MRLVDFTGGNAFGDWLEQHATQAVVFTEKGGQHRVVDSTSDFAAMCQNLAFSFSLLRPDVHGAGERLTSPAAGVATEDGVRSPAEVAEGIGAALGRLRRRRPRGRAAGGIVNDGVLSRPGRRAASGEALVPCAW